MSSSPSAAANANPAGTPAAAPGTTGTRTPKKAPPALPGGYEELSALFQPLFDELAAGASEREQERVLPFEQIRRLDEAGFGTLRVPREHGGPGASLETFLRLLIDLAQADSSIAHQYRSHFGFLDSLRFQPREAQETWYPRILAGDTVGNASTEKGGNALGRLNTVLSRTPEGVVLTGEKFYSTGTIFADYTRVSAGLEDRDGRCFALVPTDAEGVTVQDDWDGFGQKLTGTGTTTFDDVRVEPNGVLERVPGSADAVHEAALFQLILLAVLAGIAHAARRDAAALVASRKRTFNTGSGLPFREDPLIQEAVGRIAAKAYAADAVVIRTATVLDDGLSAWERGLAPGPGTARTAAGAPRRAPEPHRLRAGRGTRHAHGPGAGARRRAGPLPHGGRLGDLHVQEPGPPLAQRSDGGHAQSHRLPGALGGGLLDQRHPAGRSQRDRRRHRRLRRCQQELKP